MIVYGHRGAKGEAPENSLAGFRQAFRHGIRHFELDLVLSKDGKPVIIHDLTVDRTTGRTGEVHNYTATELADMDARRNTTAWPSKVGVPGLEDLLDEFPEIDHLQLEVKKDARQRLNVLCNRIIEVIQRRRLYGQVVVTSSDTRFLREVRRRDRKVKTGLVTNRKFPRPVNLAARIHCDFLCLGWKICSKELVDDAHRRNLKVSTWTVNRIHDMLCLEDMGVDSIITDYPTSTRIYFDNRAHNRLQLATSAGRESATTDSD